jgi:hypothetical protein
LFGVHLVGTPVNPLANFANMGFRDAKPGGRNSDSLPP